MGQAVGIEEDKQKLSIGKALIRRFCTPDKEGNRVSAEQEPEKWGLFEQYNKRDVEAERALLKRFLPWPMPEREQLLWQQDIKMNSAGVRVETRLIDAARMVWADEKSELTDEAMSISGLDNPASVAQLRAWLAAEMGGDEVSVRKEDVKDLLSEPSTPQSVRRMLEIRQRLGKTSVAKYDTLAAMTSSDDDRRVRGLLQFYGAHTGRWSGRGIQVQNLPKPNMNAESLDLMREQMLRDDIDYHTKRQILNLCFGNLPDTLSQLIRTTLIAKEGNTLAVADYSAIEARVVAWLAGEEWVNQVFKTHGKIYEAAASQMFQVPLETIAKGQANYGLRAKGKVATLALGYGGGASALIHMGALKMGLQENELPDIVTRWRTANPHIRALWYNLENAALDVVQNGTVTEVNGLILRLEVSPLTRSDWYLTIELPSGRKLFYPRPKLVSGKFEKPQVAYQALSKSGGRYESTWGGPLTENVVQAIARDCLAHLLLRINDSLRFDRTQGVRFHVHDEVVLEVPKPLDENYLKVMLSLMAAPISWARGLVLKGEGFISNYYRKD